MLHGTLPRAFLASGLNYLGGYYGEDIHPYATATSYVPIEDHYSRMAEQQALTTWQSAPRSLTPSPLDLSLKPAPPTPTTPKIEDSETIEVDDEEDRRIREDAQRYLRDNNENAIGPLLRQRDTIRNHHDQLFFQEDLQRPCSIELESRDKIFELEDPERGVSEDADQQSNSLHKYNTQLLDLQKLQQNNPAKHQVQSMQNYHQQLLLTPQHHLQGIHAPMTPPSTPSPPQCPRKRLQRDDDTSHSPSTPTCRQTPSSVEKPAQVPQRPKKKHARRLKFDEDTSSPVSGTVILGPDEAVVTGDIDPAFNIVEVTEEARAELAKIENRLGPYQCKLCRQLHEDAFQLAQHRCSRIAHVEYRCPECDKRFSCPANLASHRRWHKPRLPNGENAGNSTTSTTEVSCTRCDAKFTRQAALRKHLATQHPDASCDNNNDVAADAGCSKVPNGANVHVGQDLVGAEMP